MSLKVNLHLLFGSLFLLLFASYVIAWYWPASSLELNYQNLEFYLSSDMWEEADRETTKILLKSSGKNDFQLFLTGFYLDDLNHLSCQPLIITDSLWRKYSQDKFGFGIQSQIWFAQERTLSNKSEDHYISNIHEIALAFEEVVQWNKNAFQYSINAPVGHLPSNLWIQKSTKSIDGLNFDRMRLLFLRFKHCLVREY